ncbi:RidA family protein [Blastococcus sp. SYSU D00669]
MRIFVSTPPGTCIDRRDLEVDPGPLVAATVVAGDLGASAVEINAEGRRDVVPLDSWGTVPGLPISLGVRAGEVVYLSGQLGIPPGTDQIVDGGAGEQTIQIFRNLEAVLAERHLGLADVAKTTVYLTDMADFPAVNAVYESIFGDAPPARTTVGVHALAWGAAVEIEAVALASGKDVVS